MIWISKYLLPFKGNELSCGVTAFGKDGVAKTRKKRLEGFGNTIQQKDHDKGY
jgi:hypothetical protein